MEDCQLILNSNGLCVICLSEVEAKVSKADLFPLHHLTSKINSNLGSVFKDVTVPWAPNAVMDRLEVLADVCEGCGDLCEELLYKFQDDVEKENCIESILDKMEGIGLEDKYKKCGSPSAVFYAGIVDRLRKEIIQKLHLKPELGEGSNQSVTGAPAGIPGIPNVVNIPDLPLSQICSYLSFEDVRNCSTVSKELRRLVFPSFLKSSFITFQNQSEIPAMIDFIKVIATNTTGVNLLIKAMSFDELLCGNDSALLNLFQECGSHIIHLKLSCGLDLFSSAEKLKGLTMNSVKSKNGNELLPNLKKLDLFYYGVDDDRDRDYLQIQMVAAVSFLEAVFMNSSSLKELKMKASRDSRGAMSMTPPIFQLIGKSEPRLEIFEAEGFSLFGEGFGHFESLNLKRVVLDSCLDLEKTAFTHFLERQGNILKYLEFGSRCDFTFPRMEALETLKLNGQYDSGPVFNHKQLPNLKTIEVFGDEENYVETLLENYSEPTTSVKELKLLFPNVNKDHLISLASVFKSLSKLEVPVASCLKEVWKDLSGLEELTLHAKSFERIIWIDDIITGLEIKRKCLTAITDKDIRKYEMEYEEIETKKSLALLKRLRLLRIRQKVCDFLDQRIMLSDISCKLVLMKMESLKCIDFCRIHPSIVGASRKVLDKMGKKMDLYFGQDRDWNWTE